MGGVDPPLSPALSQNCCAVWQIDLMKLTMRPSRTPWLQNSPWGGKQDGERGGVGCKGWTGRLKAQEKGSFIPRHSQDVPFGLLPPTNA